MFFRLLTKSLVRRASRKLLAVLAVWIGTSLIIGLLALGLDVGDKMNRELRSFGANIRLEPATAAVPVRLGGHELLPAHRSYLNEGDLAALKSIFWANNILDAVPRVWARASVNGTESLLLGTSHARTDECLAGVDLAHRLNLAVGQVADVAGTPLRVAGIVATGSAEDGALIAALPVVQKLTGLEGKISEVEISALTTPENKLAEKYRLNPESVTAAEYERWICTPYPGSVAADIQKAVPGSVARVVRRVSESQGVVLTRIQGLLAILGVLSLVACSLSVMGVLTSAVLERRTEVALLQAIGARGGDVMGLFLTEAALLGLAGGLLAAGTGLELGRWLVRMIFHSQAEVHLALAMLAPLLGVGTALAASALPVLQTLRQEIAPVLHGN